MMLDAPNPTCVVRLSPRILQVMNAMTKFKLNVAGNITKYRPILHLVSLPAINDLINEVFE